MVFFGNINDVQREIKNLAEYYGGELGMDEDAHWIAILYKLDTNFKIYNNNIRRAAGLKEIAI